MNQENVKKEIFPKVDLSKFAGEHESLALEFLRVLMMAFLNCGGLFIKDRNPLQETSDAEEIFQFGDFSRLIALLRKLYLIAPMEDSNLKLDQDQESAIKVLGVKPYAYIKMIRELRLSEVGLYDFDESLDDNLRDEFIILLNRAGCLFHLVVKSNHDRPQVLPGFYSELSGGPYHKLNIGSTIDNRSEIIAGLAMVIDHDPVKKESESDSFDEIMDMAYLCSMSYDYNYYGHHRKRDTKSYFLSLAAPVSSIDLLRLKIARIEVSAVGSYSPKRNMYLVKQSTMIHNHTIASMAVEDPNHESASEDLARVLSNCMQLEQCRESFSVERQEELVKLARLWERYFDLTQLGFSRRSRRVDGRNLVDFCNPRFIAILAGKTSLPESLDFLRPPKINSADLAEREFRYTGVLDEGFETETVLFDGAEVARFLASMQRQSKLAEIKNTAQVIDAVRRSAALTPEVIAEVQALCPKCPCPKCTGSKQHTTESAFAQADVAVHLVSEVGLVICNDTSSILNISDRQAGYGSGWTKKAGSISVGNVWFRAFNKDGNLVLTIRVERS